jgi:hypothetical protein
LKMEAVCSSEMLIPRWHSVTSHIVDLIFTATRTSNLIQCTINIAVTHVTSVWVLSRSILVVLNWNFYGLHPSF